MRCFALHCSAFLLSVTALRAQSFTTTPCDGRDGRGSSDHGFFSHGERVCEMRRATLPLVNGQVRVSGTNGSIEVVGEDRRDIALEARVTAEASDRGGADALLHEVRIMTTGSSIQADGPHVLLNRGWSVDYRLRVPRHLAAQLHTENGGIALTNLDGHLTAETTNGGLTLDRLAGDVRVTTVNGGLAIALDGDRWHGGGLSAKSTNGAISVKTPDHYSAHLIAETVNGGIAIAFPVTVQGEIRNHLDTVIGQGGATLQFETVNGGVAIRKD